MKRDDLCLAVLTVASLFFVVSFAQLIRRRGPVEMRAPATVVSNGYIAQRPLEPYLLFLAEIRRLLPFGASVAVVGPGTELGPMDYVVAIGQLPRNEVEPRQNLDKGDGEVPRFVAVYLEEFRDDRYRMIAAVPSGHLYEVRR